MPPTHTHPDREASSVAPVPGRLVFDVLLARAGWYGRWLQVQRGDELITLPFRVAVAAGEAG
jgi:hypothetical protein